MRATSTAIRNHRGTGSLQIMTMTRSWKTDHVVVVKRRRNEERGAREPRTALARKEVSTQAAPSAEALTTLAGCLAGADNALCAPVERMTAGSTTKATCGATFSTWTRLSKSVASRVTRKVRRPTSKTARSRRTSSIPWRSSSKS